MRVQSISRPYIRPHSNGPHVFDRARYHEGTVKELRLPRRQVYVHTAHYVGWLAERNKFSRNYASPRARCSKFERRRDPAIKPSPSCNSMRSLPPARRYLSVICCV